MTRPPLPLASAAIILDRCKPGSEMSAYWIKKCRTALRRAAAAHRRAGKGAKR